MPMNPNVIGGNPAVRSVVKGSRLTQCSMIRQTAGTKRSTEDDVMVFPAKRAHKIPSPWTQVLLLSATGRKAMLVSGEMQ